jgi:hypothetical protein
MQKTLRRQERKSVSILATGQQQVGKRMADAGSAGTLGPVFHIRFGLHRVRLGVMVKNMTGEAIKEAIAELPEAERHSWLGG